MIRDRKSREIPENSGQGKALKLLYRTTAGRFILKFLTMPIISKIVGAFMDSPLSIPLIQPFIRNNHIDMSQYKRTKFNSYNEFFTREIKPSARPISKNPDYLISPCDSKLTVYKITENSLFEIKDSRYSVADLLDNRRIADRYKGGYCLIFRLCVDDYHRYCYIDNGIKSDNRFINGELHTVNPIALENYNIYKRNCREYTILCTENFGDVVQVEVGAMLVGRICNHHKKCRFRRGEEKGMFRFGGSTVVLLFQKDKVVVDDDILRNSQNHTETVVHYGEKIGVKKA